MPKQPATNERARSIFELTHDGWEIGHFPVLAKLTSPNSVELEGHGIDPVSSCIEAQRGVVATLRCGAKVS